MPFDLFSEFPQSTKESWSHQAIRDLKGKDFDQSLKSHLWERVELDPIYTREDLNGEVPVQHRFHKESEIPGLPPRQWANVVSIFPGDSAEQILDVLENGAEGLVLHLSGFEDLIGMLKGVKPEYIPIFIQPIGNPIAAMNAFSTWVEDQNTPADQITGGLLWTPSDLVFDQGAEYGLAVEIFQELLELAEPFPNFKSFTLKTSRYTEAGGNPLDAVIFGLGELIELIDLSGESPEKVFKKMLLEASVGDSHFGEIARLKVFRESAIALCRLYSIELDESDVTLLAQTSHWSKSILDTNSNLIRQTYEAMAAVLGGANLLWTKPILEDSASDLEKRIARNVSLILKEEAYLDKVIDPAAGSFFLENLQMKILAEFQDGLRILEEKGGWLAVLKSGEIHSTVRSHREKIQNEVAGGHISKIGANKFPATGTLNDDLEFEFFEEKSHELKPVRASYLTELQNQNML
ncbi:methylmalonyl-CoA mutase family protein [Algoriphagus terrigena]|uniref:methylmalonyl-CoA mutase family protein n=1 Tax=Algoriphagus terrigena TaxID=344884 RepID=UPI00040FFFC2|nr:methylmalonyl-CoA mutase family protein [Algoriphagus terrigena]